ncbi:MAG: molybdenum ABC transporter ATP-binding protein [Gammaproteobacteria bacterium]|nr:molybdenum ABC transporter ATP-binding protein [Pseudomonadales bacterium]
MIELNCKLEHTDFTLDVGCTLPGRGVTVLFGPSGSGKTSLLRSIAGLERLVGGRVVVNGEVWQDAGFRLPVHRRSVGYVFQQAGLFPHLSVRENLLFGARHRSGTGLDVAPVVETLGLATLLSRGVRGLSGGEQQRVALGRALLSRPRLLLLDEPLAALDVGSKSMLIPFLENALHLLDIPAIYVTHSPDELVRLADHVVVMEQGRVVTGGPLVEVFSDIATPLNRLDDAFSVLPGRLLKGQLPGLSAVQTGGGNVFHVPLTNHKRHQAVRLKIQARDVSLCLEKTEKSSILNILPAIVEQVSEVSSSGGCTVKLDLNGDRLLARISAYSRQQLAIETGSCLYAQVKAVALLQGSEISPPAE